MDVFTLIDDPDEVVQEIDLHHQQNHSLKKITVRLIALSFLFIFGTINASSPHCEHYLCVGAIFQNEGPYLKEWIEYHHMNGVEKFFLYNNESTDDFREILKPYVDKGLVELIDWPTPEGVPFLKCQKRAYNDCIQKQRHSTKWIAFIDIDEFIVPVIENDIPAILKHFEGEGGLYVHWQNFGTSGLATLPENKLMIESLIMKYPWDYKGNCIGKTIVQPSKVRLYCVHNGHYDADYHTVNTAGAWIVGAKDFDIPPAIDQIRINHYFTRAEDFYFGVKIARKERLREEKWSEEKIKRKLLESNQVKDEIIFKYVDPLRKRMGK